MLKTSPKQKNNTPQLTNHKITTMSLKENFETAVKESKELTKRPDNETLLKLYSLYKQATDGDISPDTPVPNMFDFVNKAKYEAWKSLTGITPDTAMTDYIDIIEQLKGPA
jgi:diazepam-binding inhibitor (GABA receptor modulating acyl-CoA-binding protein)